MYRARHVERPALATGSLPIHALPDAVTDLPVMALAGEIAETLSTRDVLLRAEPGAGKSTGLPLALLLSECVGGRIILLEPRRLAARMVASRLAAHLGEKVGQRIGLRMRADTRVSAHTQLTVVTEGVLTRIIQDDPELEGIGLIIFDEFHERSLHADVGLALTIEVQQALRSDLRLLLMSATLDAAPLSARLADVADFECAVRQHPVDILWAAETSLEQKRSLEQRVLSTVLKALSEHDGDVLVFLPGVAEITRCARLLRSRLSEAETDTGAVRAIDVHLLHSGTSADVQHQATAKADPLRRRVILSTSLAETSITIDGVRIVVDAGLERRGVVDTHTGGQRLETVMASQASATQRAGRAGRTSPGVCYRLWNESGHARRAAHWQAEIHRADLAPLVVELGLWGAADANELAWLEPPPSAGLARAQDLLMQLGLWHEGQLTTAGRKVATLPVHPRLGHMLAWGAGQGREAHRAACRLAAVLDDQARGSRAVNLELLLHGTMTTSQERRARQLERLLPTGAAADAPVPGAVLLAQAYPDWIAQRRPGSAPSYRLACGAGVTLPADDELAHAPWLVVAELGGSAQQLRVFKALELDIDALLQHVPERVRTIRHIDWDDKQQRVIAEDRQMLGQLIISARPIHEITSEDRANSLMVGIRRLGLSCLPWNTICREWQARVERMRTLPGQTDDWPAVDDSALLASLDLWLLPWLNGVGSIKALKQLNLHAVLNGMLEYRQQQILDEWLPMRYTVPSGSRIALSYLQSDAPVLSVRLQEMLGCVENPAVAHGQLLLKVELLSPAGRPVQVTTDLGNFWANSYPAVKKDMAGRYPRHVWPDDPMNARPTTRTRRAQQAKDAKRRFE